MSNVEMIHHPLVQKAISFAETKHIGVRRRDGFPYLTHPLEVLRILLLSPWKFTAEELAAAVLHDIVEDTETTFEELDKEFGDRIAAMVWLLSKPKDEDRKMRRMIYYSAVPLLSPALIAIKLADMLHNLTTLDGIGVDPDWAEEFRGKIIKYGLPLVDVLKMHGECWHEYAEWIRVRMECAINQDTCGYCLRKEQRI